MGKSINDLRLEAAERGDYRFDPGRPCVHGHWADRYVSDGMCVTCALKKVQRQRERIKAARKEAVE